MMVPILQENMIRFRHDRPRRAMAAFSLALFLAGTHYCLVGMVASRLGAHLPCMEQPVSPAGSCHAAPVASHCSHAATPASRESRGSSPARSATPPCCVALAPVLATPGVKILATALTLSLPLPPAVEDAAPAPPSWCGYRVTRDAGPPALLTRAPRSTRAPPLA
jgi:hypothetical protein